MLPNLLLGPSRICARSQDSLHLLYTQVMNLARNKPPDTLVARWARQTALIRPELVEEQHTLQGWCKVHCGRHLNAHLIEANHGRELLKESAVEVTRIQANGHDGSFVALCIDVDKMEFGFAAGTTHRVIGRRVNMPSLQIDCLLVVSEAGVCRVVAVVLHREGRAITPIIPGAGYGAVVLKNRNVVESEAVRKGQSNWRLLCSRLAQAVFRTNATPVERGLISPVILGAVAARICGVLPALEM